MGILSFSGSKRTTRNAPMRASATRKSCKGPSGQKCVPERSKLPGREAQRGSEGETSTIRPKQVELSAKSGRQGPNVGLGAPACRVCVVELGHAKKKCMTETNRIVTPPWALRKCSDAHNHVTRTLGFAMRTRRDGLEMWFRTSGTPHELQHSQGTSPPSRHRITDNDNSRMAWRGGG